MDEFEKCFTFVMSNIIKYFLIPGQIENIIIFIEAEKIKLEEFKLIIKLLELRFVQRVYRIVLNFSSDSFKQIIPKLSKNSYMYQTTQKKIIIFNEENQDLLLNLIDKKQLITKYGGQDSGPLSFW